MLGKRQVNLYKKYKETGKTSLIVYLVLRILVLFCLVREAMMQHYQNVIYCIVTLLLFTLPIFVEERFRIDFPDVFESAVYLFIFAAEILGEMGNFYNTYPYWDNILHGTNGFLCAALGFSLFDFLNRNTKGVQLSASFLTIVAFCFSMTVGALWELYEYTVDITLERDMQRDRIVENISSKLLNPEGENEAVRIEGIQKTILVLESGKTYEIDGGYLDIGIHDSMKDLVLNMAGAILFNIFGYLYVSGRDRYKLAEHLIPKEAGDTESGS